MVTDSVIILSTISASLGAFGALVIILLYLRVKSFRTFFRKSLCVLSVYDFIVSTGYIIPGSNLPKICRPQGLWVYTFGVAIPCWTMAISIIVYLRIVKSWSLKRLNKIYWFFHILISVILIVVFFAALAKANIKAQTTKWCWATEPNFKTLFYSFYWMALLICFTLYILTIKVIRKSYLNIKKLFPDQKNPKGARILKMQIRISSLGFCYLLVILWSTIKRTREIILGKPNKIRFLDIMQAIFSPSQGFLDFLIFVIFDSKVRKKIPQIFRCKHEKDKKEELKLSLLYAEHKRHLNKKKLQKEQNLKEFISEDDLKSNNNQQQDKDLDLDNDNDNDNNNDNDNDNENDAFDENINRKENDGFEFDPQIDSKNYQKI
ncbi:g protein-coupled receptor [Anaeramoeba ignava]|uniref:G protein-coupled receptor n=1 Tax=Anaeramoeba ignava TaxID=1746090 RepID=A0A9Q0LWC9_ANAIG|nr:g protein-coupled receptor [Anaeramoeba ignava]